MVRTNAPSTPITPVRSTPSRHRFAVSFSPINGEKAAPLRLGEFSKCLVSTLVLSRAAIHRRLRYALTQSQSF